MIQNATVAGPTIPPLSLSTSGKNPIFPMNLLISLRWIAILGQSVTVMVTDIFFGFSLPLFTISFIIALSIMVNLVLYLFTSRNRRIPASQMFYYLLYDLGQLGALLFVTGGLNNPFCIFILVPVVIAAGFSTYHNGLIVSAAAIFIIMILAMSPYALPWAVDGNNQGLILPELLRIAILIALIIAVLFVTLYAGKTAAETRKLSHALQTAENALTHEQRLSSLGALAAAAAHELGSPLTTIMLIAKELSEDKKLPLEVLDDLSLILEQSYRCRDILEDLAKNCAGEKQIPYETLPLSAAIDTIVQMNEQSQNVSVQIQYDQQSLHSLLLPEPLVSFSPEFIHGLGNVIRNAIQFCETCVEIHIEWSANTLYIIVKDDGPGYPLHLLGRLGEPYTSSRLSSISGEQNINLGLGLFIAQTLLAQKGAKVYFHNEGGAVCTIEWEYQNEHTVNC